MAVGVLIFGSWKVANVEMLGGLCAGTMNYSRVGGGGKAELMGVEKAGFLSGLSEPATLLAMAKYMRDEISEGWLEVDQFKWLVGVAKKENWGCRSSVIDRLACLTVREIVHDKCRRCNGTKFIRAKVCTACKGTGFRSMSGREIAAVIHVPESTFRRVWKDRYEAAVDRIRGLDADINRAVARANWNDVLKRLDVGAIMQSNSP